MRSARRWRISLSLYILSNAAMRRRRRTRCCSERSWANQTTRTHTRALRDARESDTVLGRESNAGKNYSSPRRGEAAAETAAVDGDDSRTDSGSLARR